MAGMEVLLRVWKDLGIQLLVLLSFALQVILLISAELRQRKDSGVLRAAVWSAYLMADTTAIYALGHLAVTSSSPEHQLMAFWAPFLLLHLGGQDNITAYAIEDNRLWLRHVQALAVQVAAAAYVLYESTIVGSQSLLWRASILMFVVGVLKYGEKIWALKCASASQELNKNYVAQKFIADRLTVPTELQEKDDLLWIAHFLLDVPKLFFARSTGKVNSFYRVKVLYTWGGRTGELQKLLKLVEMQLSLMHDILYSKAVLMHTWYGLAVRVISSASSAAALVLFHRSGQSDHRHGYNRVDVAVTYALLVGAIVLETTSLLRAMFSSWALANLKLLRPAVSRVRRLVLPVPETRRWWSDSMGQHNLFELVDRRKTSQSSRIARWMGVEDWWNTMVHSRRIPVSPKVKQLLVELLFEAAEQHPNYNRIQTKTREAIYTATGLADGEMKLEESILVWHIATNVFLRWYKDDGRPEDEEQPEDRPADEEQPEDPSEDEEQPKDPSEDEEQSEDRSEDEEQPEDRSEDEKQPKDPQDLVEVIEAISNYMLFLLVARPSMLPNNPSRDHYSELCFGLGVASDVSTEDLVRSLQAYGALLNQGVPDDQLAGKLDLPPCRSSTLQSGAQLGAALIGQGLVGTPAGDRVNQIARELGVPADDSPRQKLKKGDCLEWFTTAWAMMLLNAGSNCGAYPHVKQLSNGGELLTVAALLEVHFAASNKWEDK